MYSMSKYTDFTKACFNDIFHEHVTNSLVIDTRSQAETQTWSPQKAFICNECLKILIVSQSLPTHSVQEK